MTKYMLSVIYILIINAEIFTFVFHIPIDIFAFHNVKYKSRLNGKQKNIKFRGVAQLVE